MNPDFKNCFIMRLSIGIFSNNHSWFILSKHPFMSPSSIHWGEHFLASTQNICSQASFAFLPFRKPNDTLSPLTSAIGSSANA